MGRYIMGNKRSYEKYSKFIFRNTIVLGTYTLAFDDTAWMFYYWIYFFTNKSMHFYCFLVSLRIT